MQHLFCSACIVTVAGKWKVYTHPAHAWTLVSLIITTIIIILWSIGWPRMWLYCRGGLFNTINFCDWSRQSLEEIIIYLGWQCVKKTDWPWEVVFFPWILCPIKCTFLLTMQLVPLLHWIPIIINYSQLIQQGVIGVFTLTPANVHVVSPSIPQYCWWMHPPIMYLVLECNHTITYIVLGENQLCNN